MIALTDVYTDEQRKWDIVRLIGNTEMFLMIPMMLLLFLISIHCDCLFVPPGSQFWIHIWQNEHNMIFFNNTVKQQCTGMQTVALQSIPLCLIFLVHISVYSTLWKRLHQICNLRRKSLPNTNTDQAIYYSMPTVWRWLWETCIPAQRRKDNAGQLQY